MKSLKDLGFAAIKNPHLSVEFRGATVGVYVPDIIVNDMIIIELKCKPFLHPDDVQQFWEYLKATEYMLGFLVNFGKADGAEIVRRVYEQARKHASA